MRGWLPTKAISAILELAHVVQRLAALNDPGRGVTVNVGVVSGGTRPNVVAAESRAEVDVRVPTSEDAQRVAEAILGLQPTVAGARLSIEMHRSSLPLEPTPRNQQLWQAAQQAGSLLGLELEFDRRGRRLGRQYHQPVYGYAGWLGRCGRWRACRA